MPSVAELWASFKKKEGWEDVKKFIAEDDSLVNATTDNGLTLLQVSIATRKPDEFIFSLAEHPKLNLRQKDIQQIATSARCDVLRSLLKNPSNIPNIVCVSDQLTYEVIEDSILMAKSGNHEDRIKKLDEMQAIVRDVSILHAIDTDDDKLMDRLENAGMKPESLGKFGKEQRNETRPRHLLTDKNPNLKNWFDKKEQQLLNSLKSGKAYQLGVLQQRRENLIEEHVERQAKIMDEAAAKAKENLIKKP